MSIYRLFGFVCTGNQLQTGIETSLYSTDVLGTTVPVVLITQ